MQKNHRIIVQTAASKFGIRIESTPIMHFSEHSFIASLQRDTTKVFLRITNDAHKKFEQVVGELQWIDFLVHKNLPVSKPVLSVTGNLAERVITDDDYLTVVCFEEAQGRPVNDRDKNEALFKRMGIFMGKMHSTTKEYIHKDPTTSRPEWSAEAEKVMRLSLPDSESDIIERYHALYKYIKGLDRSENSYGLIHADLHYGNFFINGDSISVFDFDASRYSWFVDDIAIALFFSSPVHNSNDYADTFLTPFLEGYRTENNIDDEWLREIPCFVKLREMGRYLKLLHSCKGKIDVLHSWGREFMKERKEIILRSFPDIQ